MAEDLYETLGVSRSASEVDIKKSYRQLARKYHPDVNKEKGAEDKFKKIQRAYEILSDSQKKAQYDRFGIADDAPAGRGSGFSGFSSGGGFETGFEDIFDAFFGGSRRGGGGGRQSSGPRRGEDLRFDLEITLEEAAVGLKKDLDVFHLEKCASCQGTGAQKGSGKSQCSQCQGTGQVRMVQRTLLGSFTQIATCPACHGEGQIIKTPCSFCQGRGVEKKKKTIKVEIPAGVDNGTRLRVTGEGNAGDHGGTQGDLYVFIGVRAHRYFHREADDVYIEVELPMTQAVLGTEIEIPTLTGKALLKIPTGTQPETVFRLKGKGLPHLNGFGAGDQHVKIKVNNPPRLSEKESALLDQLAKLRGDDKPLSDIYSRVRRLN